MTTLTNGILIALATLLAVAGFASAQSSCPECDDDGAGNEDNTYHSIDVGAIENYSATEAIADTDAAHGHGGDGKGFWGWLSICLHAFLGKVESVLGVDLGVDANAEVYVSEDGVDLDATAYVGAHSWDFDDSEIGDLDGHTWEAMQEVNAVRTEMGVGRDYPVTIPEYDGIDMDVCLYAEVRVAGC